MKTWNLMMIMNFPFCYEVGFNLIKQLYKLDSMFVDGEFNWNFLI
jgi:high-affinity nickel permease